MFSILSLMKRSIEPFLKEVYSSIKKANFQIRENYYSWLLMFKSLFKGNISSSNILLIENMINQGNYNEVIIRGYILTFFLKKNRSLIYYYIALAYYRKLFFYNKVYNEEDHLYYFETSYYYASLAVEGDSSNVRASYLIEKITDPLSVKKIPLEVVLEDQKRLNNEELAAKNLSISNYLINLIKHRNIQELLFDDADLLDIGCGVGNTGKIIRSFSNNINIIGVDISSDRLKKAIKIKSEGVDIYKSVYDGDVYKFFNQYPDAKFKCIFAIQLLKYLGDLKNIMSLLSDKLLDNNSVLFFSLYISSDFDNEEANTSFYLDVKNNFFIYSYEYIEKTLASVGLMISYKGWITMDTGKPAYLYEAKKINKNN